MTNKKLAYKLNQFLWLSVTDETVTEQKIDSNIHLLLIENTENPFLFIYDDDNGKPLSFGEMIIIEKLSIIYLDIVQCKSGLASMVNNPDEDFIDLYESTMYESFQRLLNIRKAHPEGIELIYSLDEEIHIKSCPYLFFTDILLHKTGAYGAYND